MNILIVVASDLYLHFQGPSLSISVHLVVMIPISSVPGSQVLSLVEFSFLEVLSLFLYNAL